MHIEAWHPHIVKDQIPRRERGYRYIPFFTGDRPPKEPCNERECKSLHQLLHYLLAPCETGPVAYHSRRLNPEIPAWVILRSVRTSHVLAYTYTRIPFLPEEEVQNTLSDAVNLSANGRGASFPCNSVLEAQSKPSPLPPTLGRHQFIIVGIRDPQCVPSTDRPRNPVLFMADTTVSAAAHTNPH